MTQYFELKENESTVYQNLEGAAETVLEELFLALTAYIKKKKSVASATTLIN